MTTSKGAARGSPEAIQILVEARAKVSRGWIQQRAIAFVGTEAVAWCATGALDDSGPPHGDTAVGCRACEAREILREVVGAVSVPEWNDEPGRTRAEVLAAFDRAIELASDSERTEGAPK